MPKQRGTPPAEKPDIKKPRTQTKAQARAFLLEAAPWLIKPGMIRKSIRRSLTDQPKGFKDKLDALFVLIDRLYDLDQQEDAMNPHLLQAQRNGSIKREFDATARALTRAWKEVMDKYTP